MPNASAGEPLKTDPLPLVFSRRHGAVFNGIRYLLRRWNFLTLSGERTAEKPVGGNEREVRTRLERGTGRFYRQFILPQPRAGQLGSCAP